MAKNGYKTLLDGGVINQHDSLRDAAIFAFNSTATSVLILNHEDYLGVKGQTLSSERVLYTMHRKFEFPMKVWGVYENFIEKDPTNNEKRYAEVFYETELLAFMGIYKPVYYLFEAKRFNDVYFPSTPIYSNPEEYDYYYKTLYRPDAVLNAITHGSSSTVILIEMFKDVKESESNILPYAIIDLNISGILWNFRERHDYSFLEKFKEDKEIAGLNILNSINYMAGIENMKL